MNMKMLNTVRGKWKEFNIAQVSLADFAFINIKLKITNITIYLNLPAHVQNHI